MVDETGLETLCTIANTPSEMVKQITALLTQPFSGEVLEQRRHVLGNTFENDLNAKKLARLLFGTEF
jgi:hypothetical protein